MQNKKPQLRIVVYEAEVSQYLFYELLYSFWFERGRSVNIKQLPVSCLPVSLFQDFFCGNLTLEQWAEFAETIGLDYIDINRRCLMDSSIDEVEKKAADLRLPVMMVTTYSDFSAPEASARATAIEAAKKDILITGALGGKYIRLTAGQHYPRQDENEAIDYIYDGFEACIPTAEFAGVRILLENHSKPGAWQYDDFDFHFARMVKLWEKMKELPIGVNYDTANGFALDNWLALMEMFGTRIETIHMNDLASISPLQFACVGEGIVPLEEQMKALYTMGFRGPVCIEEAAMEGKNGVIRAVQNTRAILESTCG